MIELPLLIIALGFINRARGGGCPFINRLPGHTRYYAAALAGTVCVVFVGPLDAAFVAVSYLAWAFPSWGRWYDLGALDTEPNRPLTPLEQLISRVTDEDAVAFTIRNFVALIPAALLLHPGFLLMAFFQTAAYGFAWRFGGTLAIPRAEYLTGALWAVFIWGLV